MKSKFPGLLAHRPVVRNILFGLVLGCCASVSAQNLLKNYSFEDPIDPPGAPGTNNWTTVFVYGGPADFAYADRTTEANKSTDPDYPGGSFGAAFRPLHAWWCHAYHKQLVTGLTPGASYTLSGYMHTGYDNQKLDVYMAMFGGPNLSVIISNRATTTRTQYFMTNTASASGEIEVRVGLNKRDMVYSIEDPKWVKSEGWFDVFVLKPTQ